MRIMKNTLHTDTRRVDFDLLETRTGRTSRRSHKGREPRPQPAKPRKTSKARELEIAWKQRDDPLERL